MTLLLTALIPLLMVANAFAFGIAKDGSPLTSDWWTAGPKDAS